MFGKSKDFAGSGAVFILALLGVAQSSLGANDCPALLPAQAEPLSSLRLCHASAHGVEGFAVCREYSDDQRLYKVMFQGGALPTAVLSRSVERERSKTSHIQEEQLSGVDNACDLVRPAGVPLAAAYRGTGVCRDGQDQPLPCSVYEHAGAREAVAMRYFVYYEPNGSGIRKVDALSVGRNVRALEAEISYQLGRSLASSACCREEARGYLAHAAMLFPRDAVYANALHEIQVSTAASVFPDIDCGPGTGAVLSTSY
jgi:hypothetical protein